jgi:hypothetical protein
MATAPSAESQAYHAAADAYDLSDPKHPSWLDSVLDRVD